MKLPKSFIRQLLPESVLERYRRYVRRRNQRQNQGLTAEQVFTAIYEENRWGGKSGEFCSGSGTTEESVVLPYIKMVVERAASEGFAGLSFVDLGCGDFRVGKQLRPLCSRYIGVDIVKTLILKNTELYGDSCTRFVAMDMVMGELPNGDVCFVRQVLQHLSNEEIVTILRKLTKYRWVFITEHHPMDSELVVPNVEKAHGGDVRVWDNSGVFLSEPPFSIPSEDLEVVLEVPGVGLADRTDQGVIRTYLYRPRSTRLEARIHPPPTSS